MENTQTETISRNKIIIQTSIVGIVINILLALVKVFVGLAANSIAIVLDAVNNTSDATSSLITGIGTKLASKGPDKKHPFGYGRVEYLTALIIAAIVLYAGITSLIEAVKRIFNPGIPEYSLLTLVLIAISVIVKIMLGLFFQKRGKLTNSDSLINSGKDALLDAVISTSTLIGAVVFLLFGLSLEVYLGAIISIFIIKSGIEMLSETLSKVLGDRADVDLAKKIRNIINSFEDVKGCYDLILNNYGPDSFLGSVHIEVLDTYPISSLDVLSRDISAKVFKETGVILTAIGVYAANTANQEIKEAMEIIRNTVFTYKYVLQMHGFYMDLEKKTIRFDLIISFEATDRKRLHEEIIEKIHSMYPDYSLQIVMDTDFIDI